jgi:hypothetical protein
MAAVERGKHYQTWEQAGKQFHQLFICFGGCCLSLNLTPRIDSSV